MTRRITETAANKPLSTERFEHLGSLEVPESWQRPRLHEAEPHVKAVSTCIPVGPSDGFSNNDKNESPHRPSTCIGYFIYFILHSREVGILIPILQM